MGFLSPDSLCLPLSGCALRGRPQLAAPLPAAFELSLAKGVKGRSVRALTVCSLTSSCFDTQLLRVVVCFHGCYCFHPLLLHTSGSHWILGNPASSFLKVRKPSNLGLFDKWNILLPSHFSSLGASNFHCCYSLGASIILVCSLNCASLRGGPLFQHSSLKTTELKSVSIELWQI